MSARWCTSSAQRIQTYAVSMITAKIPASPSIMMGSSWSTRCTVARTTLRLVEWWVARDPIRAHANAQSCSSFKTINLLRTYASFLGKKGYKTELRRCLPMLWRVRKTDDCQNCFTLSRLSQTEINPASFRALTSNVAVARQPSLRLRASIRQSAKSAAESFQE
jgi:hypothetical protein